MNQRLQIPFWDSYFDNQKPGPTERSGCEAKLMYRRDAMKTVKLFVMLAILALVSAAVVPAQERAPEKLGKVHFPVSCSAAAQEQFDRAVALLHSFWLDEADRAFAAIARADSGCAMAYWGTAMTLFGNPFTWPLSGKALPDGW